MLDVFQISVHTLFDPRSKLYFTIPYITVDSGFSLKKLLKPLWFSTLVGYSFIGSWVYRNYTIIISHTTISIDLAELDMIDFNVILWKDCPQAWYALV